MTAVLMIITHSLVNYLYYKHLGLSGSTSLREDEHAKKAADLIDSLPLYNSAFFTFPMAIYV